jgi:DNA-binding NtrC family response regulator
VEHFRRAFNAAHGLKVESFAPDALDVLYRHGWPGNVRQLRNVVERAMVMAPGARVEREQIQLPEDEAAAPPRIDGLTPRQERILALARQNGGVTNSAVVDAEGISSRTALRELQRLVERGLLVRVGRRRGAIYRAADKDQP